MTPLAHIILLLFAAPLLVLASGLFAAETYRVNPKNSSVEFAIGHLVFSSVSGEFQEFDGTIEYDARDMTNSSLTGSIKAASIDTGNDTRDQHLRSEDYFDVRNYPEIRFQSKRVRQTSNGNVLIGDLTMRGVKREIEIPFTIGSNEGDGKLGFRAQLELNRQDYGIKYGGLLDGTVGDIVTIELSGEATRQQK